MVTICSVSSYLEYLLKYSLLLDNCDPAYLEGLFIIVPSRVLSVLPFRFWTEGVLTIRNTLGLLLDSLEGSCVLFD